MFDNTNWLLDITNGLLFDIPSVLSFTAFFIIINVIFIGSLIYHSRMMKKNKQYYVYFKKKRALEGELSEHNKISWKKYKQ